MGGGHQDNPIFRGNCLKKGGAWKVCRFKEGELGKKEGGGVFERGVDTPMHTMIHIPLLTY